MPIFSKGGYGLQVIVFSFSKKECEALALQMAPLDLNDESEHKLVEGVFWNAVDSLSEDDRRLPQVCAHLAGHTMTSQITESPGLSRAPVLWLIETETTNSLSTRRYTLHFVGSEEQIREG